jgi:16S rRNA (guanine966-N2)-methyltransferase
MSVRIIGGELRGRRIELPRESVVRPTSDRAKVALFNSLGGALYRARVVDLCAGTGALGLEGLSRGAERAVFVENDSRVARWLQENLTRLGVQDRAALVRAECLGWLDRQVPGEDGICDVLLADPPYDSEVLAGLTERLTARPELIAAGGWVVLEDGGQVAPELPANEFSLRWRRKYGSIYVSLFRRGPEEDG